MNVLSFVNRKKCYFYNKDLDDQLLGLPQFCTFYRYTGDRVVHVHLVHFIG